MAEEPLLSVRDLRVAFEIEAGLTRVIHGLSFEVEAGETLGIVGESGCGKSMTALALMGLIPRPPGVLESGEIRLMGEDLAAAGERRMQRIRGDEISMVFQEPMTALNPVFTVGEQIAETVRQHTALGRKAAWDHAVEMLRTVGIPAAERRAKEYPHQMSGGMRQRVMIAMALACEPKLLIADEPTTALDVTVQAQIFDLFDELQEKSGAAIILITHDIGVIARMTRRVMVMYAGRKVEEGFVEDVLRDPRHPYTQGLIACVPHLEAKTPDEPEELFEIPGVVPGVTELSRPGCPFAPRCSHVMDICRAEDPPLFDVRERHRAACWLLKEGCE